MNLFSTSRTGHGYLKYLLAILKVDDEDLPEISELPTSQLGLLLQLSIQPNKYTQDA